MKYTQLGKTGLQVSRIAVGGYVFSGVNKAQNWNPYSPEGRAEAIHTIHTALDAGINYIDTAPSYGNGHSESIIGEVMKSRRQDCYLATKVRPYGMDKASVIKSVEDSLQRLQTDYVDVIQFHGGDYTREDFEHIMHGGPLDALLTLRDQGKVRLVGLTTEEAYSALDLAAAKSFDVIQVCYNLIYQSAARHLLEQAAEAGIGIAIMRPMTSGILQRLLEYIAPEWLAAADSYEVCLKFVLSDPRVHLINVGMRWSEEVRKNVDFVNKFEPSFDISQLPRLTAKIYETDDLRNGF
ncbi:aldo/keto reductase [Paenibacillus cremeus]|uniref:Aldo/keto reductase n=1 Tax=Paenibacillus cremeus TaxID=2163881 RepID=A0A559JSR6_9BACL|nr:aldo/keto reductase [Paenibacillus cremeus]TVY02919.1 aldo/keto reductase [Paenibacillus cremeus]